MSADILPFADTVYDNPVLKWSYMPSELSPERLSVHMQARVHWTALREK